MDQMILDEAAIVPLYYDQVIRFVQNDIVGFVQCYEFIRIEKRSKAEA